MPEPKHTSVVRLATDQFNQLEKAVTITNPVPKTDLEAGFALGVAHVLKALRTGYVVGA